MWELCPQRIFPVSKLLTFTLTDMKSLWARWDGFVGLKVCENTRLARQLKCFYRCFKMGRLGILWWWNKMFLWSKIASLFDQFFYGRFHVLCLEKWLKTCENVSLYYTCCGTCRNILLKIFFVVSFKTPNWTLYITMKIIQWSDQFSHNLSNPKHPFKFCTRQVQSKWGLLCAGGDVQLFRQKLTREAAAK